MPLPLNKRPPGVAPPGRDRSAPSERAAQHSLFSIRRPFRSKQEEKVDESAQERTAGNGLKSTRRGKFNPQHCEIDGGK